MFWALIRPLDWRNVNLLDFLFSLYRGSTVSHRELHHEYSRRWIECSPGSWWALRSHQLAAAARDAGRFDAEIVPVTERPGFQHDEGGIAALWKAA